MFGTTLSNILSSFNKVQNQLEDFLRVQEEKLKVNSDKQSQLASEAETLTADQQKAERVLERVKALTE
ncbi:hypothetical protein FDJ32_gp28 [Pseudomonas phage NV1]|uniref:Uncharacterized protein n=1 Tax=Pseudomonas phage NV1 TaxID=2079543 RepID=A0A2L0HPM0_9CAUD|nr:hypothetical protein FDJ32_gp28 [Pseudomonas phage NV1]AUX83657.1 hypothetical protein NV1_p28 [Pseudomonas phage NV1]